jgi:hypothetical protein
MRCGRVYVWTADPGRPLGGRVAATIVPLLRLDTRGEGGGRLWGRYVRVRNGGFLNEPGPGPATARAEAFQKRFGTSLPEIINNDHRIVIVASELDDSSERIVQYLATRHSLNINVVFLSGCLTFVAQPGKAPIVHFNGPLSVRFASAVADMGLDRMASALAEIGTKGPLKVVKEIPLPGGRRRSRTVVLSAGVGTPGWCEGTFATYKAREVLGQPNKRIAVQVGFPNQDARRRPILVAGFLQPDS